MPRGAGHLFPLLAVLDTQGSLTSLLPPQLVCASWVLCKELLLLGGGGCSQFRQNLALMGSGALPGQGHPATAQKAPET